MEKRRSKFGRITVKAGAADGGGNGGVTVVVEARLVVTMVVTAQAPTE